MRTLPQICARLLLYPLAGFVLSAGFLAAGDSLVAIGEEIPDSACVDAGYFPELPDFTLQDEDEFEQTASHGSRRVPPGESQNGFYHALSSVFCLGRSTKVRRPRPVSGFRRTGRSPPSRSIY